MIKDVVSGANCLAKCSNTAGCDLFAWSPNSHNCYLVGGHEWAPGWPNEGYVLTRLIAQPHNLQLCTVTHRTVESMLPTTLIQGGVYCRYISGCKYASVSLCGYNESAAPCPSHLKPELRESERPENAFINHTRWGTTVTATVGAVLGQTSGDFRMLGVNFDFWPASKSAWGTCGVLTSVLDDPKLLPLVSRLNGSMLRIGGSPAGSLTLCS